MTYRRGKVFPLLSFSVIEAAVAEDPDAIGAVLAHYGRYIAALSTQASYDDESSYRPFVNDELQHRLEAKLTASMISFKLSRDS